MKKLLLSLISLLFAFNAIAQQTYFDDIEKGLRYEVTNSSSNPPEVSVGKIGNAALTESVNIPAEVTNNETTYTVTSITDGGFGFNDVLTSITIPNSVTSIGAGAFSSASSLTSVTIPNSVTSIGADAFSGSSLTSVTIPNSVTSIGDYAFEYCNSLATVTFEGNSNLNAISSGAFQYCTTLSSITIPKNVKTLGMYAFMNCSALDTVTFEENSELTTISTKAFYNCNSLTSITIPKKVAVINNNAFMNCKALATVVFEENSELNTIIGYSAFSSCDSLKSIIIPKKVTEIGGSAFSGCDSLTSVTFLAETAPSLSNNTDRYPVFSSTPATKTLTVPFGSNYSAWETHTTWGEVNYKINAGETKTLDSVFSITDANKITNEGVLKIDGQLIITAENKVINDGVMVIEHGGQLINATDNNIGGVIEIVVPTEGNAWNFIGAPFAGYTLGAVKPVAGSDVAMVKYLYTSGAWSNDWATFETSMEAGEGIFAWPFYDGEITFSTYNFGASTDSQYPADATASYALNNGDVTVTKSIQQNTANGYWMALANPYPAKLSADLFLAGNNNAGIQGNCVYVFRGGSFDIDTDTDETDGLSTGDINMTEGFFVNFASTGDKSVTFKESQLTNWPTPPSKSEVSPREFIELTLQNGNDEVRVYLAQNEDAEQGYDIFDANKMFATTGVAEPYFVTDGIALIKEEVRDLPYYATMNVRSQQDTVMSFVLTNLPEGYAVSIIDGEEVIDMVEGGVYSTEILTGENADRFKVLVKKNVGLADVEELDVRITNSNRHIAITAQENVRTEVYNTLGQKVFETEDTNFVLSGVASGAYVVKVQGAKASKSQKIIVE